MRAILIASLFALSPIIDGAMAPAAAESALVADGSDEAASPEAAAAFEMLRAAVARAAHHGEVRFAFTARRTQTPRDGEPIEIVAEFDPSRPEGEVWRVVSPDPATADKKLRKGLDELSAIVNADEPMVYDGLGDLKGLTLVENGPETAVFVSRELGEDAPKDALEARLTLTKSTGHISSIEVVSIKSFKPNPIVKISSHRQVEEFAAPVGDGPALLTRSAQRTSGSAAFNSFDMSTQTEFDDVRTVEAPPRPDDE